MGLFGFGRKKEQEKQAELARQRELERQKEQERQTELARQKELERQRELAKRKETEAQELAKKRESQSAAMIQEIRDTISECNGIAIVNYGGLTVQQDTDLRVFLRAIKVTYKIYKNVYFQKALENTDFENLQGYAEGGFATAFFKDLEQLGLLLLYCQTTKIDCSVDTASYQKKLLLPTELEKMLEDQVQKVREKYADRMPDAVAHMKETMDFGASSRIQITEDSLYDRYFLNLIAPNDVEKCESENLSLYLTDPGEPAINSIKLIHDIAGLGLKESKDVAEKARKEKVLIRTFGDKESLLEAKKRFDEIGAKTE